MKKAPLQVLITAGNEEDNIRRVLDSVFDWADHVLLMLDSNSTDKTHEIAREYQNIQIYKHPYDTPARQKNRGLDLLSTRWTLILDADEVVTDALKHEIDAIVQSNKGLKAYWIRRRNNFMGRWIRFSGWQGDKVIRLIYNDGTCRYPDVLVHEEMECSCELGRIDEPLLHYTYRGLDHYLQKIHRYATWQSEELFEKGKKPGFVHFVIKPLFRFVKHYFLQQGFRDGIPGLAISAIQAWGVFERYIKLAELHRKNAK
ncbi:glycosyltransferase family 2 protein [Thermaurantimonas aggregans]|nr:glycosyltransferase family 2 protein [Thermaurantimonas aggregans]MCX8149117.1 glycosyltransferase family 2 protein [Thermaurantimonas aggregans]